MNPYPLLISIPHGGTGMPIELKSRVCITEKDLFDDMDPYTREIYHPGSRVMAITTTDIARAFIDLNRAADDRPPKNPDGVVKSMTCFKKPIYKIGREPDDRLTGQLLEKYYYPYHEKLKTLSGEPGIKLALDCHSMAASPPPIAPDAGRDNLEKRPLICLGDVNGRACDRATTEKLAVCFRDAFGLEKTDVSIDLPFSGGYITRTYGNKPLPWVQVEMNRSMYLSSPWFDPETLMVQPSRLKKLNRCFMKALQLFFDPHANRP